MDELFDTVAYFATSLLYPVVSGPIAAYVLVLALKRDDRRLWVLFWPLLVAVHVAGYILMMRTLGDFLPGPGSVACFVTPIFVVGTALGLRVVSRRSGSALWQDPVRRAWLVSGTILIPLLQVVTVVTLVLLAPSR
jgi:hypothetical protein